MLAVLLIIIMIALDQASKLWALSELSKVDTIALIDGVFHLTYVENRGAAFSILQGKMIFLVIMTLVVLIGLIVILKTRYFDSKLSDYAIYLIIGGAIGNLIDRVRLGFVVDMFDFRLINFPVFNIADIFVCVGTGLLLLYIIVFDDDKNKEKVQNDGVKEN